MTRYQPLPKELYISNREKFYKQMKPSSVAVFNSNDIYPVSADSTLPFAQHRDIFYLCGINQEESVLVLVTDQSNHGKAYLFLKETNKHIAVWEGEKLSKQQATFLSGVEIVHWLDSFHSVLFGLMRRADCIYFNTNEHSRFSSQLETREDRFIAYIKKQYPAHQIQRSAPILQSLRGIKNELEIGQIQRACNITRQGFESVLKMVKPNIYEYEIEAQWAYEFTRRAADGFAYTPIVASGNNATVLHYIKNNNLCKSSDLVLMDVGASYGLYASDLTRVVPVDGVFTARQKQVYNAVLFVKNQATALLKEGLSWKSYNNQVGELMTKVLLDLKLLDKHDIALQTDKHPAFKRYFMHGTSHHLGLDTHDYGETSVFKANMVVTVEPGIYIPEESIGIRLEDNVVIQKNDTPINLMQDIPIEVEHIELIMNSR